MHSEEDGRLLRQLIFNAGISFVIKKRDDQAIRNSEAFSPSPDPSSSTISPSDALLLLTRQGTSSDWLENHRIQKFLQVDAVSCPPVPGVSDVPSVHDLAKDAASSHGMSSLFMM